MGDDWQDKIFEEKSLWQVYARSKKAIPRQKANLFSLVLIFLLSLFLIGYLFIAHSELFWVNDSAAFAHKIADAGTILSLSILGFLIAGFSIFASVTKTELFVLLAKMPYRQDDKDTGISRLQFLFFNFLNVFSIYIFLLVICMTVDIGFDNSSPLQVLIRMVTAENATILHVGNCAAILSVEVMLVEAILRLKSFIWNLYQSVLLTIATEYELQKKSKTS